MTSPARSTHGGEPQDGADPGIIVQSQNAPPRYVPQIADLRGQLAK